MAIFNGQVANISDLLDANGQPNKVMIDRYWGDWIMDRVQKSNNFSKSGIVGSTPQLDQQLLQAGRGRSVSIPHLSAIDLRLKPQRLTNHTDIVANPSGNAYPEHEVKILQAQSWGDSAVDDYLTGVNQLQNISNQATDYWTAVDQRQLINTIKIGFLNDRIRNAKELDYSNRDFSAADFTKANARMGDNNMNALTKIVVNSAVYQYMIAQDLIKYIKPSGALSGFQSYNGKMIVVDDDIPVDAKTGKTYALIFGNGAVTYSAQTLPNGVTTTVDNNAQGGIKAITHKRVVVSHINGTSADLATAADHGYNEATWDLALDDGSVPLYMPINDNALRNINLVKYDFKIDTDFVSYSNSYLHEGYDTNVTAQSNADTDHTSKAKGTSKSSGSTK